MMFNFGAHPAVSNVSYNTSYAHKMSVSLLDLMGPTKFVLASYAYNISMYCIPQLMVNVNRPVRSVNTFPVLGSARPIAENTEFVVYSLGGKKYVSISTDKCSVFFDLLFFHIW